MQWEIKVAYHLAKREKNGIDEWVLSVKFMKSPHEVEFGYVINTWVSKPRNMEVDAAKKQFERACEILLMEMGRVFPPRLSILDGGGK